MTEELEIEAVKFNHRQKKLKLLPRLKIISCQVCEKIFNTNNEVNKHVADKSIIFRDGKCLKGVSCDNSHVGFGRQQVTSSASSVSSLK